MFIWERSEWPILYWRQRIVSHELLKFRMQQNNLIERMWALGFQQPSSPSGRNEKLNSEDVISEKDRCLTSCKIRNDIANRLGLNYSGQTRFGRAAPIVQIILDATRNYADPITPDRLFDWHASLFPGDEENLPCFPVGAWRDDRMQVTARPGGLPHVTYIAPPAYKVDGEMQALLAWVNKPPETDPVLQAAILHLWFLTIHPFGDGNGRIARALAELALARSERSPQRFYLVSTQIVREKKSYHKVVQIAQRGSCDVTTWLVWFIGCLGRAIENTNSIVDSVLENAGELKIGRQSD